MPWEKGRDPKCAMSVPTWEARIKVDNEASLHRFLPTFEECELLPGYFMSGNNISNDDEEEDDDDVEEWPETP